jgi:nitroreductase
MDFWQIVKKRFMCRSYLDREVPKEVLDRILEVVDHLPSAGHTQPQEFIVIRNQNTKQRLAVAALGQRYVAEAPLVIVVVSDTRRSKQRYGGRGEDFYSIVDGAFAAMLLMLACINEGSEQPSLEHSMTKQFVLCSSCPMLSDQSESSL